MALCFIGLSWKTFITGGSFTDSAACKKVLWSEAFSGKFKLNISNQKRSPIYVVVKNDFNETGKHGIFD